MLYNMLRIWQEIQNSDIQECVYALAYKIEVKRVMLLNTFVPDSVVRLWWENLSQLYDEALTG